MPHIFISYCHKDQAQLERLLSRLKDFELLKEIWYDKRLEAGAGWIPQIEEQIGQAYAMIVIATPSSMNSTFVTYEWSTMLAAGMPVFPLLMEGSYDDLHPILRDRLHCPDCRQQIDDTYIESILEYRLEMPEISFLNMTVCNMLLRIKVGATITFWFSSHMTNDPNDYMRLKYLVEGLSKEADNLITKLNQIMMSQMSVFTRKQISILRKLLINLRKFWYVFHFPVYGNLHFAFRPYDQSVPVALEYWNQSIQQYIEDFQAVTDGEGALNYLNLCLQEMDKGKAFTLKEFSPYTLSSAVEIAFGNYDLVSLDEYGGILHETLLAAADRLSPND